MDEGDHCCLRFGSRAGAPCTHLLAVLGRVRPVVQAGLVSQPEGLLQQVLGEVLEGPSEDKVAQPSVLFLAVMAEVDEVLDVVVATNVLELLTKTERGLVLPIGPHGDGAPTCSSVITSIPTTSASTWTTNACSGAPA